MDASQAIELSLFARRIEAVCDEMGAQLRRAAFSPNIRDRLDYSCAVFDVAGELAAQAAHIPVHLGSMAYAMQDIVRRFDWRPGDQVILNDPFMGGTHLPDVTLVMPVFHGGTLVGFVANRAHYADIGASAPGSMPLSTSLAEEGVLIPPQRIASAGALDEARLAAIVEATRNPTDVRGDLQAQLAANRRGGERLLALVGRMGVDAYAAALVALNDYAERLARAALADIPPGTYRFEDVMEDDGQGGTDLPVRVAVTVTGQAEAVVDFTGTHAQTAGNINCPLSVTAAGVWYVFRCLMPPHTPACAGTFRTVRLVAPAGSLLNAAPPAAVAAGNVETSSRVVDVVLGALARALPERIPAASQGTMNNIAFGQDGEGAWGYYETLGGGMGGGPHHPGLSAVQSHMTNTRNTPVEVLELRYPVRVLRYALRHGSGGAGRHPGGDGLVREYEFLAPATLTFLTERRRRAPWGLRGGAPGAPGLNHHNDREVPAKTRLALRAGDRVTVATPGGGGWGDPAAEEA